MCQLIKQQHLRALIPIVKVYQESSAKVRTRTAQPNLSIHNHGQSAATNITARSSTTVVSNDHWHFPGVKHLQIKELLLFCFASVFLSLSLTMQLWLTLNSLCRPGQCQLKEIHLPLPLKLQGIKRVRQHIWCIFFAIMLFHIMKTIFIQTWKQRCDLLYFNIHFVAVVWNCTSEACYDSNKPPQRHTKTDPSVPEAAKTG